MDVVCVGVRDVKVMDHVIANVIDVNVKKSNVQNASLDVEPDVILAEGPGHK